VLQVGNRRVSKSISSFVFNAHEGFLCLTLAQSRGCTGVSSSSSTAIPKASPCMALPLTIKAHFSWHCFGATCCSRAVRRMSFSKYLTTRRQTRPSTFVSVGPGSSMVEASIISMRCLTKTAATTPSVRLQLPRLHSCNSDLSCRSEQQRKHSKCCQPHC
jgi:hypothetical protein